MTTPRPIRLFSMGPIISKWRRAAGPIALAAAVLLPISPPASAQQPPPPGKAGGVFPATQPDDTAGFTAIFDGKTLAGWDGDTNFWRVENGEIIGETTPDKPIKQNSFLIWRGERVRDFELKLEFRLNGTNSGIQYRSAEVPSINQWTLKGYQADIDFGGLYTGNVHDERGRGPGEGHAVLSRRGQVTRVVAGPAYKVVGNIADPTLLRGVLNVNGWNRYHIIARGPVLMQFINEQLMALAIDEDPKGFYAEGVIGLQMHTGPPFRIQYRNIMYKKIQEKSQ